MIPEGTIHPVRSIDIRVDPSALPWATARAVEVEANWLREKAANPHIFNGEVVLMSDIRFEDGRVSGVAHVTRYASQLYWIRHGRSDTGVAHLFSAAIMVSEDGAVLLGRMSDRTVNAGEVYAPCGSLDRSDIVGDRIDVFANMAREVAEETGLDLATAEADPECLVYRAEGLYALFRIYRFDRDAETLIAEIDRHIASDPEAELSGVVAVRGVGDITADMKPYMRDYLMYHFAAGSDDTR
ncbi:MAG: DNA mismatch repair protein MutT [Rhizobiales bacterium]|nr:DNA mismatch repair protein MutT [Hyphomicrobiales bacterium]MBA67881.1 DNA mismatch repair protein MutT [Hyphomicrobiales bacterium]